MIRTHGRVAGAIAAALVAAACGETVKPSTVTASAAAAAQALDKNHDAYQRANDPTAAGPAASATPTSAITIGGGNAATGASAGTGTPSVPATPTDGDEPADAPTKISARHVLIQWMGSDRAGKSVMRTREQALAVAEDVLKRARRGDDVGRLAVEYSDEPNAASRGGSLGRFSRGQMVPAFDAVVFKLRVGQISDIVETPFGFHIIQRTE